jgi:hypothetical protein
MGVGIDYPGADPFRSALHVDPDRLAGIVDKSDIVGRCRDGHSRCGGKEYHEYEKNKNGLQAHEISCLKEEQAGIKIN